MILRLVSIGATVMTLASAPAIAQAPATRDASPSSVAAVTDGPPARDSALETATRRVAAELRCPVCQGLSLADSPSELALEMKDVVRQQLAAGRTADEVKQYFVAKYGEWILLEPPRRGVNLLAYATPAVGLVVGFGVVWVALRRWTKDNPPEP